MCEMQSSQGRTQWVRPKETENGQSFWSKAAVNRLTCASINFQSWPKLVSSLILKSRPDFYFQFRLELAENLIKRYIDIITFDIQ